MPCCCPPLKADGNPVLLLIQELTCHQDFIRISKPKSWNRSSHDFSLTPSSPPTCCPNTFDLLAFSGLAGPSFLISKMHKQPSSPVLKRYNLSKRHGDQASASEKICLPRHSSQVMRIRETGAAWAYGKLYSSKELQRTLTQKNRATLLRSSKLIVILAPKYYVQTLI